MDGHPWMRLLACAAFLAFVGTAGVLDHRWRRIPNWLTVTGAAGGLLLVALSDRGGLVQAVPGLVVALLVGFTLFALKGLGAGDAKFLGAIGAWAGLDRLPVAFLAMLGGGAVFALIWSRRQRVLGGTMISTAAMISSALSGAETPPALIGGTRAGKFPYGVGLGLGAAAWWIWAGCRLP